MFQSSCEHHHGVFLKTCFLKEVAKIYYLFLMWRHVCVCLCAFWYSVDVSTVAGAVSVLMYRVSEHGACIQLCSILSSYGSCASSWISLYTQTFARKNKNNMDNISGWGSHSSVAERCLHNYLRGKTIASPQLRAVRSHPYTLKWRLNAVHKSRVLEVRHKTHRRGPFKKHLVKCGMSLLQKS